MSRTLAQLRDNVAFLAGRRYYKGTSESTTATTVVSADLKAHPDDFFVNLWIVDATGKVARITDFVQSTGVLTVVGEEALAVGDFTIMSPHPSEITHALNDAGRFLFNTHSIGRRRVSESVVTGSPIYNSNFEEWDGANPVGWTTTGTRESTGENTYLAESSVRLDASETLTANEANNSLFSSIVGENLTVKALVKASASGTVTITIGTTDVEAAVVAGWQVIQAEGTPTTANLSLSPTVTAYVQRVWVDSIYTSIMRVPNYASADVALVDLYELPPFVGRERTFSAASIEPSDISGRSLMVFRSVPHAEQIIRMSAVVPFEVLADYNDTVSISDVEAELLETEAAIRVLRRTMAQQSVFVQADYGSRIAQYEDDARALIRALKRSQIARIRPHVV